MGNFQILRSFPSCNSFHQGLWNIYLDHKFVVRQSENIKFEVWLVGEHSVLDILFHSILFIICSFPWKADCGPQPLRRLDEKLNEEDWGQQTERSLCFLCLLLLWLVAPSSTSLLVAPFLYYRLRFLLGWLYSALWCLWHWIFLFTSWGQDLQEFLEVPAQKSLLISLNSAYTLVNSAFIKFLLVCAIYFLLELYPYTKWFKNVPLV